MSASPLASTVQFGDSDPANFVGGFATLPLVDRYNDWWTLSLTNTYFGSTSVMTSAVAYAILSTGQSMIYLAKTDFKNFQQMIQDAGPNSRANIVCRTVLYEYCFSSLPCSNFTSELQPLTIRLENTNFVIPPAGYLLENTMNHQCVIAVSYISDGREMYILGETFLRNFYAVFDYTTNKVQLAVNANAPVGTKIHTVKSGWVIFAYTMAATLALLIMCIGTFCFITRCCCRKKISERAK